jgi:hypothetical protein
MSIVAQQYDTSIPVTAGIHQYKMPNLEGVYDATVRSHPVAAFWGLVVLVVVVVLLLWKLGGKKEGATFASGGGIAKFQDQDDVRVAAGLARAADAQASEHYMRLKDNFQPGPEQNENDGSIYVIDEHGKKWYVTYTQHADGQKLKQYHPYKPGSSDHQKKAAVLAMYGVDSRSCRDSGVGDDAWGWLTDASKKPEETYAVSKDDKLTQQMVGL